MEYLIFDGTIDKNKRRELGIHYTNQENILKVIKPLFLDDLIAEFERIKHNKNKLKEFHTKLINLKFLDPACGTGNFLFITYNELLNLEQNILNQFEKTFNVMACKKISTNQFYGIEIDESSYKILSSTFKNTLNENALTVDWEEIVPKSELDYIMGNPPFVGARTMSKEQKNDLKNVWGNHKGIGNLDYVTGWYKKSADYAKGTAIQIAFVSTNSISQGEQPAILWEPLIEEYGYHIDFAYRTFKWGNEAKGKKAAVHCVIIGFSQVKTNEDKKIYTSEGKLKIVNNISPYLVDVPITYLHNKINPICDVPKMRFGSMPNDGGFLLLDKEEREQIIKSNPIASKWIRPFVGAKNFINGTKRWCIWLKEVNPAELKKCNFILERIESVKKIREHSQRAATKKLAQIPMLFAEIRQPDTDYILIPRISSQNRRYLPIGFMEKDIIASDATQMIPYATLYHFGVLTSNIHMAWMKIIAGRLKSDYNYSSTVVYNNFPWPSTNEAQKKKIEKAAQAVLDARKLYPDCTLADLYDPLTMPSELTNAHNNLDKAVREAYGNKGFETEEEIVASLMKMYSEILGSEQFSLYC